MCLYSVSARFVSRAVHMQPWLRVLVVFFRLRENCRDIVCINNSNDNNSNNIYLLQLGCHPVAVVILHVYKI